MQHRDPDITAKIESMAGWTTGETEQDGIGLLKLLRGATYQHDESKQGTMAIVESDKRAYIFFQRANQTNTDYFTEFKSVIKVVKTHEGSIGGHLGLRNAVLKEEGLDSASATAGEKEVALKMQEPGIYPVCSPVEPTTSGISH